MLAIGDLDKMSGNQHFLDIWLTPAEQQQLASFKLPKRQSEWLAGRICAKTALQDLQAPQPPPPPNTLIVANDASGRPSLLLDGTSVPGLKLSLSHSGEFAAALIANKHCGIDIQERRDTLLRVKERFCSKADEKTLTTAFAKGPGLSELNLLWTVKEAIRKALSHHHVPDFLKIHVDQVELLADDTFTFHCRYQHQRITAVCGHHHGYGIALTITEG